MKKISKIFVLVLLASLLITTAALAGGRGGYRGGYSHGGYRGSGYFGQSFLGATLGIIAGSIIYNALTPSYAYPPHIYYQPTYRPMCSRVVETGYWARDYYGQPVWVPTGAHREYFPCD